MAFEKTFIAMVTQTYEEFLRLWRAERITAQGRKLGPRDPLVVERAAELSRLALAAGHRASLDRAVKPYRNVHEFVAALYVVAEFQALRR
jgi:hypothetical protein